MKTAIAMLLPHGQKDPFNLDPQPTKTSPTEANVTPKRAHQHYSIHASLHQEVQPILVIFMCPNSSTTEQLLLGVL